MFCSVCECRLPENAVRCPICGAVLEPGRQKCRILKEIRQKIADENDIPFVTSECPHLGDCTGTCPTCEAELRYLEDELERQQQEGRQPVVSKLYYGPSYRKGGSDAGAQQENPGGNPGGPAQNGSQVSPPWIYERPETQAASSRIPLAGVPANIVPKDVKAPWLSESRETNDQSSFPMLTGALPRPDPEKEKARQTEKPEKKGFFSRFRKSKDTPND